MAKFEVHGYKYNVGEGEPLKKVVLRKNLYYTRFERMLEGIIAEITIENGEVTNITFPEEFHNEYMKDFNMERVKVAILDSLYDDDFDLVDNAIVEPKGYAHVIVSDGEPDTSGRNIITQVIG